ncbi:MAG: hypothetical protein A2W17_06020 [Planctomycetes bacterium RBG_16_41_13]|nr:MAG: hypothetical protein A2W17_06020 [Planctomycetes bacterium RBG_16_41_13]
MKKLKIAFLVSVFPSLSETFVLNQITGLIALGHAVDIYAIERSNDSKVHEDVEKYGLMSRINYYGEAITNMPVRRLDRLLKGIILLFNHFHENPRAFINSLNIFKFKREAASFRILYKIVPFVGKGDYDVLYCHFGPNGNLGILLKDLRIFSGKVVTVFHGYDMSLYIREHGKEKYDNLFKKGDLFLPISERWKNELISWGCREDKILVHRMGVDVEKYRSVNRTAGNEDRTIIITIARFVEKKGIRYGIEAVGRIADKRPDLEYRIIGDGPLRDELESYVDKLNIRERVQMLGWKSQEEILRCMMDSDILLAPSVTSKDGDQEGIPVVLMEAMAMGIPVVSTYHSGIPELVQDGVTGFLAPEGDVTALAEKLMYCMEHRELWPSIRKEGYEKILENYNIHKLNSRLADIFLQLHSHQEK